MREMQQLQAEHAREVENIVANSKNTYNQYLVYKEQFQWIDQRQRAIQEKNQALGRMLKETETSEKKKAIALNLLESNFYKLK